ncbi:hypothetical protein BDZ97DRAFT_1902081 [Flammula alnicola]|nr:hypothetical protein BDZ97DRAFT_1902081 [Flammula alnicola]
MFWFQKKFDPAKDLPDLSGKVVIVTGANTGIGYGTVKHLVRKGAKVYLGARSEEKGKKAVEQLKEEGIGSGEVIWLSCNLTTPTLAKESAETFLQQENRLDILGITEMMMVNHIGTFQFTTSLLPLLLKTSEEPASDVRVITLSSDAHRQGVAVNPQIDFSNLDTFKNFYPETRIPYFSRYFISKLANVLFTNGLQRRISSSNIICMSVNPGLVNTSFVAKTSYPRLLGILMWIFATAPDEGAYTSCFAAASPFVLQEPKKYKSAFLEPVGKIGKAGDNALKVELQDQLWETTEKYLESLGLSN